MISSVGQKWPRRHRTPICSGNKDPLACIDEPATLRPAPIDVPMYDVCVIPLRPDIIYAISLVRIPTPFDEPDI